MSLGLRIVLALAFACTLATVAFAHGEATHAPPATISTDEHAFGVQGDPKAATRTVAVTMDDTMRFTPASIAVREGETITFVIRNAGKVLHELVIGTTADLLQHAEMMRKHPGMEHDEPFMSHVKPGGSGRLTWRFTKSGDFAFACLVPGHYEAGMKGVITVAARTSDGAAAGAPAGQGATAAATASAHAHGAAGKSSATAATTPGAATAATPALADGEVRKIDVAAGKITLRHGEVRSIDMPPMTMAYAVADPSLLDGRKVGEKVRFAAERRNGAYLVTRIEPAR